MNYLITGGAGFIGAHLCRRLLNENAKITIIDDLSTGRWDNIASLSSNPNLRVIIASADDSVLIEREMAQHDFVFHLASAVGVRLIVDRPVESIQRIIRPTEVIVDACARYRKPILLTSTSEVYGRSEKVPFCEDADVVMGPSCKRRWAYATAKALDEFYLLAHHYQSSLPIYIVRLFNTVGPYQTGQYGMVLPRFVEAALKNAPIFVYGDGKQKRCFCSVYDVVEGLIRISQTARASGTVINLGSNEEVSIENLAQRVVKLCQSRSTIQYLSYDEAYGPGFDDMQRRVPSLKRAEELIQWNPQFNLDDIICQVIEYKKHKI
ncbi:MAG: GDP-mannose 4,6-dehydratase [Planctomycetia bacterium]|nr:GDP-mannose 4,6-dehydratase [Planctomycetia bacterium]